MRCWCSQRHAGPHSAFQSKRRRRYKSSPAVRKAQSAWRKANPEKMRTYRRKWETSNLTQRREYLRRWWKQNSARLSKEAVARLKDGYVAAIVRRFCGVTPIPRAFIEAKRAQLMIHRLTRSKT